MKVCFFTLGCKVNQHETGALSQMFFENGYDIENTSDALADVYVVNSCTVTATGDKKSLQWLRRAKRDNPAAVTVLTGCYPQAFPNEAKNADADIIIGNTNRTSIIPHINEFMKTGKKIVDIQPHLPNE
ncbi:MAG: tRNA (N(6)-L-threonylcarbamoyladenosine(37)-C(2))-methylthiotransferase MtaB, partial [Oscillospiraceae bacterium]